MTHHFSTFVAFSLALTACVGGPKKDDKNILAEQVVLVGSQSQGSIIEIMSNDLGLDIEWLVKGIDAQKNLALVSSEDPVQIDQLIKLARANEIQVLPVTLYSKEYEEGQSGESASIDHHDAIHSRESWQYGRGNGVLVAVTDDGLDYKHEDLSENIWNNRGEVGLDPNGNDRAANGIDDDNNGYVDDFRGWDIGRNDNDVKPEYSFHYHGTFVAGLIAASANGIGADGIAPEAKLLPIKFRVGPKWTSADIFKAYKYASDSGARIINTSYDLDAYANDPVVAEALDYVYERGLIVFNSAGNDGKVDTPRQSMNQVLIVCAMGSNGDIDKVSPNSNTGKGIDICAPVSGYSTLPNNKYSVQSGTSFSSAMAAGAAAVIWSGHPEYSRDQVVAALVGTASPKDAENPEFQEKMGSGLIDVLKAVSEMPRMPEIRDIRAVRNRDSTSIVLSIRGVIDPSTVELLVDRIVDQFGEKPVVTIAQRYFVGSNEIAFRFVGAPKAGRYTIDLNGLKDPFGQAVKIANDGSGVVRQIGIDIE